MTITTILTAQDMTRIALEWKQQGQSVGFVPTMGALHRGHIHLVESAKSKCDRVVVSIFVNPLQFGPSEDFSKYPRTLPSDLEMLTACGVDRVFLPSASDLYPDDFQTHVSNARMSKVLCGAYRPGHFDGVLTVVLKLLNIVGCDHAFFGKKDYQQWRLVSQMAKDLCLNTTIVGLETVREDDGLAMSSRNRYLSDEERKNATLIFKGLGAVRAMWLAGQRDSIAMKEQFKQVLAASPYLKIQYADILKAQDLSITQPNLVDDDYIFAAAVYYGTVRLIDNVELLQGDLNGKIAS
jgi:pantoate--beta-alanine ligase